MSASCCRLLIKMLVDWMGSGVAWEDTGIFVPLHTQVSVCMALLRVCVAEDGYTGRRCAAFFWDMLGLFVA